MLQYYSDFYDLRFMIYDLVKLAAVIFDVMGDMVCLPVDLLKIHALKEIDSLFE